jgi:hypothetical protein
MEKMPDARQKLLLMDLWVTAGVFVKVSKKQLDCGQGMAERVC